MNCGLCFTVYPDVGSRKPWVACIEAKVGCEKSLEKLFNVFEVTVDSQLRKVKAPKKLLWDMIDADIQSRQDGTIHTYGSLCFRLEFLGTSTNHPLSAMFIRVG